MTLCEYRKILGYGDLREECFNQDSVTLTRQRSGQLHVLYFCGWHAGSYMANDSGWRAGLIENPEEGATVPAIEQAEQLELGSLK